MGGGTCLGVTKSELVLIEIDGSDQLLGCHLGVNKASGQHCGCQDGVAVSTKTPHHGTGKSTQDKGREREEKKKEVMRMGGGG